MTLIKSHPNLNPFIESQGCPNCASGQQAGEDQVVSEPQPTSDLICHVTWELGPSSAVIYHVATGKPLSYLPTTLPQGPLRVR